MGMVIPFLNAICMFVAFSRLKAFQITSWDRDDHFQVTQKVCAYLENCRGLNPSHQRMTKGFYFVRVVTYLLPISLMCIFPG